MYNKIRETKKNHDQKVWTILVQNWCRHIHTLSEQTKLDLRKKNKKKKNKTK